MPTWMCTRHSIVMNCACKVLEGTEQVPLRRYDSILINLLYESESLIFKFWYKDIIILSILLLYLTTVVDENIRMMLLRMGFKVIIKVLLIVVSLSLLNLQLEKIYKKNQMHWWQENKAFYFVMGFPVWLSSVSKRKKLQHQTMCS